MNALLGQEVKVQIELPDGRTFDLGDSFCSSIEISSFQGLTNIPGTIETEMKFVSLRRPGMSLSDTYKGKSEAYCAFCYSEWVPDSRGNCGACGAPKKAAKVYDGDKT